MPTACRLSQALGKFLMQPKVPPANITKPETFILESLEREDEKEAHLDGKILYDVLKPHGKNPIYYYFRTQRELVEFAKIFRIRLSISSSLMPWR